MDGWLFWLAWGAWQGEVEGHGRVERLRRVVDLRGWVVGRKVGDIEGNRRMCEDEVWDRKNGRSRGRTERNGRSKRLKRRVIIG